MILFSLSFFDSMVSLGSTGNNHNKLNFTA